MKSSRSLKYWIWMYGVSFGILLIVRFIIKLDFFDFIEEYIALKTLEGLINTLITLALILLIRASLEKLISKLDKTLGERYNLRRVVRLVAGGLIVFVGLSFLFHKPYTFLTGLGIVSLVLGFALQAPITSFIAWLYIVFKRPFKVGDRIQIKNHHGDVVEISYLDSIIEEFHGDYVKNDQKTGRLIHFPNSIILTDKVINYSGQLAPYIWNETAVQIAYTSNLEFVERCLLEVAEEDFKEHSFMGGHIKREDWKANVYFRVNDYSWLEAVVSYPVEPRDTTGKRNRIIKRVLPKLNEAPEKVQFPEGTRR